MLWWRQQADLPPQAFNFVGVGTIDGNTVLPPDPTTSGGSARDQRNTEWYLRDQWLLTQDIHLWLGLRHTRIESTDSGDDIDGVSQRFTTPWLAASWQLDERTLVYASAGQGIETTVTPNLAGVYENPNQPLPALKSRQLELGVKHDAGPFTWSAIAFDIRKPLFDDVCPPGGLCTRVVDGQQRHRGVELDATWRGGPWTLEGSATRTQGQARALDRSGQRRAEAHQRARAQPARAGGLPGARAARAHADRWRQARGIAHRAARQLGKHPVLDHARPGGAPDAALARHHHSPGAWASTT